MMYVLLLNGSIGNLQLPSAKEEKSTLSALPVAKGHFQPFSAIEGVNVEQVLVIFRCVCC
jgi:hypothetical protein